MANRIWKEGARRAIAYVEDRDTAEQVMQIVGRRRATAGAGKADAPRLANAQESALNGAMAVYSDKNGRPFAWQIPFDLGQWERVAAVVEPAP